MHFVRFCLNSVAQMRKSYDPSSLIFKLKLSRDAPSSLRVEVSRVYL